MSEQNKPLLFFAVDGDGNRYHATQNPTSVDELVFVLFAPLPDQLSRTADLFAAGSMLTVVSALYGDPMKDQIAVGGPDDVGAYLQDAAGKQYAIERGRQQVIDVYRIMSVSVSPGTVTVAHGGESQREESEK